mgnify:CR=1 FL=1|tara:strand:+ start:178 stop:660 length:483 start_codon:yes stop_codon:yes gene_type:complete
MQTLQIDVFNFHELNDTGKEKGREWYRSPPVDYACTQESVFSIKSFCDFFGVTLKNWECGAYQSPSYTTDAEKIHFRGIRLSTIDREQMPTGYCLDCTLWQTFFDEFNRTGDAKAAFDEALWQGFIDWRNDMEYQSSDEYIDDFLTANEYQFTIDGDFYK